MFKNAKTFDFNDMPEQVKNYLSRCVTSVVCEWEVSQSSDRLSDWLIENGAKNQEKIHINNIEPHISQAVVRN